MSSGILWLLPEYRVNEEDHFVRLIAPNGREVCCFGESADPREIERECFEHAAKVDSATGRLERLLEAKRG